MVLGKYFLFRKGKGPSKVEKDEQDVGEELVVNGHISRKEFQEPVD